MPQSGIFPARIFPLNRLCISAWIRQITFRRRRQAMWWPWYTAIPMASRFSAMLIAACRCKVACRGGWSAMTGYTNFAACHSSPGGHLSTGGRTVTPCSEMRTIWRVLRCRILRGGRTGGSRARICIWIIWRRQVFIG